MNKLTIRITILLILAVYPGYLLYSRYIAPNHSIIPIPFSSNSWLWADTQTRGYMLDDLHKHHSLEQQTVDYILDLLGQPDRDFDDPNNSQRHLIYNLGWRDTNPHALLKFESVSFLKLTIDESDKVVNVGVFKDAI